MVALVDWAGHSLPDQDMGRLRTSTSTASTHPATTNSPTTAWAELSVLIPKTGRTPCWAGGSFGADDEIRTRDPHLGKVMLYQLSYVRVRPKR